MMNQSLKLKLLVLVALFQKLDITHDTDKSGWENKIDDTDKKIPDTSGIVKKQFTMLRSLRLKVKYLILLA